MHHEEDPWLWKPLETAYRYEDPGFWDAVAHFNAAAHFMDGVETMLESQGNTEAGEDTIVIATAASVAYNYVRRTFAQNVIIDCLANDEYAELDDNDDPEALQAADAGFQKTEERLRSLLKRRDQALASNPVEHVPIDIARHGHNAMAAGNTAALLYHAKRIEDESLSLQERQGHMVASWVNQQNLEHHLRYGAADGRTAQQSEDALETLLYACMEMEEHRPHKISPAALEMEDGVADEAYTQLLERYGKKISYWIVDASTDRWVMAYAYQGAVYVKTALEPYQHPIDQATAIDHANELLKVAREEAHHLADDPVEVDNIRRAVILQHCTALQIAEAHLHNVGEDRVRALCRMIWDHTQDHGALRAVAQAVTGNQPIATERLLKAYTPPMPLLTWEQATKAVNAAQRAGADENVLREMCLRLDIDPGTQGIRPGPEAYRHSTYSLDSIIEWVCMTIPKPRQTAMDVVKALGRDPDSPQVQEAIARYDEYYSD